MSQAKVLWQQDQQRDAFDLLVALVQTYSSKTCDTSPTLKDPTDKVGLQVDTQNNKLLQLEQRHNRQNQHMRRQDVRIEHLEQKNRRADAARAKKQQRILLGQAAYALSKIIEGFNVWLNRIPRGARASCVPETNREEGCRLYTRANPALASSPNHVSSIVSVEELLAADKALRTVGFDDAHGSSSEMQQVTLQALTTWAGVHFPPKAVIPVQNYVKILDNFSSNSNPLVPDMKPSFVFH